MEEMAIQPPANVNVGLGGPQGLQHVLMSFGESHAAITLLAGKTGQNANFGFLLKFVTLVG